MADRKAHRRETRKPTPAPARRALNHAWGAAIIALLVLTFFHELVLGGKTFVSPDATNPAGFVRMGEQSLWHDHVYPLWNPFVFLGMPSFASGAYNPLIYPPDWPLAVVQKIVPLPDMTWLLIYYVLGGWFFFLLAREWGARAEGALLGAVAFIFAPNLVAVGSHGHGSQLVDSAYLPLMLWLATVWLRRGRLEALGALALAGGFQLLRGHVQICFYTWLAIVLYALIEVIAGFFGRRDGVAQGIALRSRVTRALALGGAAALAFGIAGFYNLPLQDYARWSIRGGGEGGGIGMARATQWSLSPMELPTIVIPGWAGFGGATYWGGMPFTDYPNAYVGMITVVLALPAFFANGAVRVFALVLALVSLLIAFGHHSPVYGFLYAHLPLFNKFRIPVMIILLFQLAVCLGTAWGWSAVIAGRGEGNTRSRPVDRLMIAVAAALGAALVIGIIGRDSWRGGYERMAMSAHPGYTAQAASIAFATFVGDLGRVCVSGLLAALLAWLAFGRRVPAALATTLALGMMLFELWPISGTVMKPVIGPVTSRSLDAGRDDIVDFLEQAGPTGTFRVLPADDFQDNRFAGFGIATLGGYHAAKLRLFQDLLDQDLEKNPYWMRLLNVRYLVVSQALAPADWYKLVHQGPGGNVYENLLALPRVTLVNRYRVVQPANAILDSIKNGTSDAAEVTFLDHDPHLSLGSIEGATARLVSYRLNDAAIDVRTPGPALLRLADEWYPDWTASVDGREVPVLKADYLLRAVAIPAGSHRVEFRFRSAAVRHGLWLSLASLAVVLALIAYGRWGARRPAPAASAAEAA